MSSHPYSNLPERAFWRNAVAEKSPFSISDLWQPKFAISKESKIATAGSCFAQHFSRALIARGYSWINAEPAPAMLPRRKHARYQYGTFSARTGNIYTTRMLRQWMEWASGTVPMPPNAWEKGDVLVDPFRPAIEPKGFVDSQELGHSRDATLIAIDKAVREADIFVFTLGLTESWRDRTSGVEFAICPGTQAGHFDPDQHDFSNAGFDSVSQDLHAALELMRAINPNIKVLLTVSPVHLTATASAEHVLVATTYSKSVLRAVAGEAAQSLPYVDYFPSYEIITSPPFRGMFYGPNQRSVEQAGVDFVMKQFFEAQLKTLGAAKSAKAQNQIKENPKLIAAEAAAALICEEEILDAFSRK